MKSKSDEKLIELIQQAGDMRAFGELYQRYGDKVVSWISRFVFAYESDKEKRDNIVQDISQDVWLTVLEKINDYEGRSKFTTWVYPIAKHKVYDYYNKRKRHPDQPIGVSVDNPEIEAERDEVISIVDVIVTREPTGEQVAMAKEFAEILVDTMATSLTPPKYHIYGLKLLGWKNVEIAELGSTPNSVNSQISQAGKQVKKIISDCYDDYSENEIDFEIRKVQEICIEYLAHLLKSNAP